MHTVLKRIRKHTPAYGDARRLYRDAFPPDERAPFFMLARKAENIAAQKHLKGGATC